MYDLFWRDFFGYSVVGVCFVLVRLIFGLVEMLVDELGFCVFGCFVGLVDFFDWWCWIGVFGLGKRVGFVCVFGLVWCGCWFCCFCDF